MKFLQQKAIIMVLILTGSLLATNAEARNKHLKRTKKQTFVSGTSTSVYNLEQVKGKISVSDGEHETIISKDPNDVQPVVTGNEVYYIHKDGSANNSSIYVFNVASKTKEDIIQQNAAGANYNTKNQIDNILFDKKSNKIYFATSLSKTKSWVEKLTWKYDISSKQLEVYKDGSIESVDEAGNQIILLHSGDAKGPYTMRTLVNTDGKVQKVLDKQYDLIPSNK